MKCQKCNAELKEGAKFCFSCGEKVPELKGSLKIEINSTIPEQEVYINNVKSGFRTPCILELNHGIHFIHVESELFYAEQKEIKQDITPVKALNFEMIKLVELQILSRHNDLIFQLENLHISANVKVKVRPGLHKIAPGLNSLPSFKIEIAPGESPVNVEYDKLIDYKHIQFQDFPDNIAIRLKHNGLQNSSNLTLQASDEIVFFYSDDRVDSTGMSELHLLPGNYSIVKWKCNSISGKKNLSSDKKGEIIDYKYAEKRSSRKKRISCSILLIIPVMMILAFVGPFLIESYLWLEAKNSHSVEAIKSFSDKYHSASRFIFEGYPYSRLYFLHNKASIQEIDNLLWENALESNTNSSFLEYKINAIDGRYIAKADSIMNARKSHFRIQLDHFNKISPGFVTSNYTDPRDGKIYKTMKIGEQVLMTQDLALDAGKDSKKNKSNSENPEVLGNLYTWEISQNICPPGWHLPGKDEWEEFGTYLQLDELPAENVTKIYSNAGKELKNLDFMWSSTVSGSAEPIAFLYNYGSKFNYSRSFGFISSDVINKDEFLRVRCYKDR